MGTFEMQGASKSRSPSADRRRGDSQSPSEEPANRRSGSPNGRGRSNGNRTEADNEGCTVYIGNLPREIDDKELQDLLRSAAKLRSVEIPRDPSTKLGRRYAFATFETSEGADEAIAKLNNTKMDGRVIKLEKSKRSKGYAPTPGQYLGKQRDFGRDDDRRRSRSHGRKRSRSRSRERGHRRDRSPRRRSRSNSRSRDNHRRHRSRSKDRSRRDRGRSGSRSRREESRRDDSRREDSRREETRRDDSRRDNRRDDTRKEDTRRDNSRRDDSRERPRRQERPSRSDKF
eukprot:TRINITY_DN353_c0_g3_i2.p1 TRINITY_DN353_c0_g3~~TRINITY_DN353_c0_g3_i2.p1  ORF type:complete len:287 (+),score=45.15 TRINITY_DN353_c0_g3_i2:137-997(+)